MSGTLTVTAAGDVPEVHPGDDLAALAARCLPGLADGDVVVVTSKVVSKAEGRVVRADRSAAIEAETRRVVARRGPTTIARTVQGPTLAAAGVDASNVEPGSVVLLPVDPDASARSIRAGLLEAAGRNVAVVVSDTAGRPWREGQTDIAVGCAGLVPLDDHAGRPDAHGNLLSVTAPAVADEVAAAADLVMGKTAGRPLAVVRGLGGHVLPAGSDGPGAAALVRPDGADMFALGAREAAAAVVLRDDPQALAALAALAATEPAVGVPDLLARVGGGACAEVEVRRLADADADVEVRASQDADPVAAAVLLERLCALGAGHGWAVVADERNHRTCRIVLRAGRTGP